MNFQRITQYQMRWTFHLGDFVWYVFIQRFVVHVFCQILKLHEIIIKARIEGIKGKIIDINIYCACQMIV